MLCFLWGGLLAWGGGAVTASDNRSVSESFFESQVRPLLLDRCVDCHNGEKRKGGLRLDTKAGFLAGGGRGALVDHETPEASLLIRAVSRTEQDLAMPPDDPLKEPEFEILRRWIEGGASWPDEPDAEPELSLEQRRRRHWAYQPVERGELPATIHDNWVQVPVDAFVLERLQDAGLSPSKPASRSILLRRAFMALIGLPPTLAEVRAFETDPRPDAFERVVEGLLSRPEYGEKWGRHWLDLARYSDAKGYVDAGEVKYPFAYTYRDYVVRAFNEDLPYDQFIREQLAADRLPNRENSENRDNEALAAMGFLTVGSRFNFFPHEIIDDRIDVTTRGFLGLSVACARCHDHKYDPITAKDYYTLYGIFAGSREPTLEQVPVLESGHREEAAELTTALEQEAAKYHQHRAELHQRVMFELRAWAGDYLHYIVQSTPEHRTKPQPELQTERGLVREVSAYASGGVRRWREYLASRSADDPVFGLWVRLGRLSREQFASEASRLVEAFAAEPFANPLLGTAFRGQTIRSMEDVATHYARLLEGVDSEWRKWLEQNPGDSGFPDPGREELRDALYGPEAPGTLEIDEAFDYCTLDESVELRKHFANVERVFLKTWDASLPRPMMMVDKTNQVPQHVFLRGDPKRRGPEAPMEIPAALGVEKGGAWEEGSGRLELAEAIASPLNPLTARVMVNRVWAWHFGQGLVASLSDFGARSDGPSHPELLDYLAHEWMKHGWSIKWLQRQIVLSATWQQASLDREDQRRRDPENRLYWKQNRRRLSFEEMRDSMLYVSGELVPRLGGTPVRLSPDSPDNRNRTLYSFVDREKLEEVFRVFDFPSPDITAARRTSTTVPQQSLFLLNNPFVIEQAKAVLREALGGEVLSEADSQELFRSLFQLVYARRPSIEELGELAVFLSSYGADEKLAALDDKHPMVVLAQTLLLSNEFLFVD